jgi:hypothetical protein
MALHLIPDDGTRHAPAGECGCGPRIGPHGRRLAYHHTARADAEPDDDGEPLPPAAQAVLDQIIARREARP